MGVITGPFFDGECATAFSSPPALGDALSRPDVDTLAPTIWASLPQGPAWRSPDGAAFDATGVMGRFWRAVAAPFADLYAAAWTVALESTPSTGTNSLADWEAELGLPDLGLDGAAGEAARWAAVHGRFAGGGVMTPADYVCLAARLGYAVRIEEFSAFECGTSECGGDDELANTWVTFQWSVTVLGVPVIDFECGESECGDALGDFAVPADLGCLIRRLAPADTEVFLGGEEFPLAPVITGLAGGEITVDFAGDALAGAGWPGATVTIEIAD